ncbi:MAG: helix-turn-helix domain-containing protein [Xanthomonadales bacterium]|nr:helix-turn-helix domain-containing protein [Xanthomonadales bacterium]
MKHISDPRILVNQTFRDIELLSRAVNWRLDFRQIDHGPLRAWVMLFGHAELMVTRVEFDRSFHQIGSPPPGFITFGLPDKKIGTLRWNGVETPPGVLINFTFDKNLDCVSPAPFGGFVLSFKEEILRTASAELGYGAELVNNISAHRFWNPEKHDSDHLRQALYALVKVAADDGDEGLARWTNVFNSDLASLMVSTLARDSLSPRLAGPGFRVAAMNRVMEILRNCSQFPINIEALCTMAGTSWATLQRAFADEFGVTPSSYIKSRRLAAVQAELIREGSQAVISDIANRWGFWHMGNFASDYRKQFGELPSETLGRLNP